MSSFVFFSRTGCLLPFLIFFNLFLGWIFLKPAYWLGLEAVLIILFAANGLILLKKISSSFSQPRHGRIRGNAVDTEAEVIKEDKK
jgi:hypothetical protein